MSNHFQNWELIPKHLPDNLQKANEQLHFAAQFLAATGHSFLAHQEDDSHTNLAWRQGLGLQSRPFQLDQEYTLTLNYELFQLELKNNLSFVTTIIKLNQKTQQAILEELRSVFALKLKGGSDRFEPIQHYELPDHPIKNGAPFQKMTEEDLRTLRLFRDNARTIIETINQGFDDASEMRIWPHHFDNGSICVLGRDEKGEMTKSVGWGFSIPNDTDQEHHFYINHWSKEEYGEPATLPALPGAAYWSPKGKLMAVLPIRALQSKASVIDQAQFALTFFGKGIKASRAIIQA